MFKFKNRYMANFAKKRLIRLILTLAVLVACGIYMYLDLAEDQKTNDASYPLYATEEDYLQNEVLKTGDRVNTDIVALSDPFYTNDLKEIYCFVQDSYGNLFVVHMDGYQFDDIAEGEWAEDSYRLYGVTEILDPERIPQAVKFWNAHYEEEIGAVDEENFETIFGTYTVNIIRDSEDSLLFTGIFLVFAVALICFVVALVRFAEVLKAGRGVTKDMAERIDEILSVGNVEFLEKVKVLLTPTHVIGFGDELVCLRYTDILWIYVDDGKFDNVGRTRGLRLFNNEGKYQRICGKKIAAGKYREEAERVWNAIVGHNPQIRVDYTKENIQFAQSYTPGQTTQTTDYMNYL